MIRAARIAGLIVQALILGTLLYAALGRIVALETGAQIFRYQAF